MDNEFVAFEEASQVAGVGFDRGRRMDFQRQQLVKRLARLNGDAQAKTTLLIAREGNCIASAGDVSYLNVIALAALAAGMFAATREVARIVGESQFSILLQQGEKRHLHISVISESTMMVVIFEDYQLIGRVRHEARKASVGIDGLLPDRVRIRNEFSIDRFREYALNLVDQIFEEK